MCALAYLELLSSSLNNFRYAIMIFSVHCFVEWSQDFSCIILFSRKFTLIEDRSQRRSSIDSGARFVLSVFSSACQPQFSLFLTCSDFFKIRFYVLSFIFHFVSHASMPMQSTDLHYFSASFPYPSSDLKVACSVCKALCFECLARATQTESRRQSAVWKRRKEAKG